MTMNISLPAPLKSWVEEQVEVRGYSTASEFVRDVLRREQQQQTRATVDALLLEAIDSGPSVQMAPEDWEEIRGKARSQAGAARPAASRKSPGRRKR